MERIILVFIFILSIAVFDIVSIVCKSLIIHFPTSSIFWPKYSILVYLLYGCTIANQMASKYKLYFASIVDINRTNFKFIIAVL